MPSIAAVMRLLRLTDRENSDAFLNAGADHLLGAEHRVAAHHDRPGGPARAGGGDGLFELGGGGAPGAGLAAAQLRLGDHRRRGRRRDRGDLRGQAQPQQRAAGDLGVPERGTLFLVPVDRAQQRVDVQKDALVRCRAAAGCAPPAPPDGAGHRGELVGVPESELAQEDPQVEGAYTSLNTRGVPPARSTLTSSMLSAPQAIAAMIEVSLPAGLTAPDLTRVDGRSTCSPINSRKTGLLSQFQHRHQPGGRHQILLVKHRRPDGERIR